MNRGKSNPPSSGRALARAKKHNFSYFGDLKPFDADVCSMNKTGKNIDNKCVGKFSAVKADSDG